MYEQSPFIEVMEGLGKKRTCCCDGDLFTVEEHETLATGGIIVVQAVRKVQPDEIEKATQEVFHRPELESSDDGAAILSD